MTRIHRMFLIALLGSGPAACSSSDTGCPPREVPPTKFYSIADIPIGSPALVDPSGTLVARVGAAITGTDAEDISRVSLYVASLAEPFTQADVVVSLGNPAYYEVAQPGLYIAHPLQWSPDHKNLAVLWPMQIVGNDFSTVTTLDANRPCNAYAAGFSTDGAQLAAACTDGSARVWSLANPNAASTAYSVQPAVLDGNVETWRGDLQPAGEQWRLTIVSDQKAPVIYQFGTAGVTSNSADALGVLGNPFAIINPANANALVYGGGNVTSSAYQMSLVDIAAPATLVQTFVTPIFAVNATDLQISIDGLYVAGQIDFSQVNGTDGCPQVSDWSQIIVWSMQTGEVVLYGSEDMLLTGNSLTTAFGLFGLRENGSGGDGTLIGWTL